MLQKSTNFVAHDERLTSRWNLKNLNHSIKDIDLISIDVFDTLLLRTSRSARSRLVAGEVRFAKQLADRGFAVSADELVRTRLLVQKLAYRALNSGGQQGEVCLTDIIRRQLMLLGLPLALTDARIAIEVIEEKLSLSANKTLAKLLRLHRRAGMRVVAISDTALPADKIAELIDYFHGPGLIDEIYSSADRGASKRQGGLFSSVLWAERVTSQRMLHIGDDVIADRDMPGSMGINTIHVPVGHVKRAASLADGATTETLRRFRGRMASRRAEVPVAVDRVSFGDEVFGPIVAQFCLSIWLYCDQANVKGDAALLFCARGGVGIRAAFEEVLSRLGLRLDMPRENLLISRLVAARSAVVVKSAAALDELGREFRDSSFADVAKALGGRKDYPLTADWQRKFNAIEFYGMLETHVGQAVLDDICAQNTLFRRHLDAVSKNAKRIILCDTGLYGSTQRLIEAGFPDRHFETIQFARANYKGLSEEHFPKVAGVVVEQNLYNPLKVETAILRYWQIIESLFEPKISSVALFHEAENGEVVANSGNIRHGHLDPAAENLLLDGTLQYISRLRSTEQIFTDADAAWRRLKSAIVYPVRSDIALLGAGPRSVDFGRADVVQTINSNHGADFANKLRSVKSNLWREGAICQDFDLLRWPLLTALEMTHIARAVSAWCRR